MDKLMLELDYDEAYLVREVLRERVNKNDLPEDDDFILFDVKNRISDWIFEENKKTAEEFRAWKAASDKQKEE